MRDSNLPDQEAKKVGFWLFLGILFVPYVFAWFTLRKGYSAKAGYVAVGWMCIVVMGPLFAAMLHTATMTPQEQIEQEQRRAQGELGMNSEVAVKLAEKAVQQVLKDPDSAQFQRETTRTLNPNSDAFSAVVCGFVNSKNSFGGYSGDKGFVVRDRTVYSEEEDSDFTSRWQRECLGVPTTLAPTGFRGLKWGARAPSTLIPISTGAFVYTHPDHKAPPFLGVPATEEGYTFDKAGLGGGDIDFSGSEKFDQLRSALTSAYGEASDAAPSLYRWTWPKQHVEVLLSYNAKFQRTSVSFSKLTN